VTDIIDWMSADFFTALAAIILINVMLSGDNAIVIALAARKLPKPLRSRAVVGGTLGAIALRVLATLFVVWLLNVPGLHLAGGIMLIWIAYRLIATDEESDIGISRSNQPVSAGIWTAIRTIVIADAVMSLDNMLAVAGAARGQLSLVVLGLLLSIPIMVLGSALILKLVDRYVFIIYAGAAVLAWTAANMLIDEPWLDAAVSFAPWVEWTIKGIVIGGVLMAGFFHNRAAAQAQRIAPGS
jgi:YjbE family integral membrane protein